jgi:hypothetical protein
MSNLIAYKLKGPHVSENLEIKSEILVVEHEFLQRVYVYQCQLAFLFLELEIGAHTVEP